MPKEKSIVEASIEDLSTALASSSITCVELVAKYLLRIAKYDCRNTALNAIPLLNEDVFKEAAAADDRRTAGQSRGVLDGIPYTVKDSYKVKGMTVASGSEAFRGLIANEDAFVVAALRNAGAILIGKTNMCPMAYGGMIRGLYGRAESPYNGKFLAAAFGSGSSNGSGVATAASFAAFGMGEETVSSGRSPASNNGLVAYTPSRGYISIRGNWPLYPTCDVIVPHTRTVDDLLQLLNVITAEDTITKGDFWRNQPLISSSKSWPNVPTNFCSIKDAEHLKGKTIAVPRMYIEHSSRSLYVSATIPDLWNETRAVLEAAGAKIEVVDDFPVLEAYENPTSQLSSAPHLPQNWNATERGPLIAHAWEDFLSINSSKIIPSLASVQSTKIFPHLPPSDPQIRFTEPANAIKWSNLASHVAGRPRESPNHATKSPIYDTPNLKEALQALEAMRKHYFEDWLAANKFDYVAFPAAGDVAAANADVQVDSAEHAWRNGVKYSHGNRMLRHLGIPSVTVSMGILGGGTGMPMGLTISGRGGNDVELLKAGWCYEQAMRSNGAKRPVPGRVPPLKSDAIPAAREESEVRGRRPDLEIRECSISAAPSLDDMLDIVIRGSMTISKEDCQSGIGRAVPIVDVYVDGEPVPNLNIHVVPSYTNGTISPRSDIECNHQMSRPPAQNARNAVVGKIARDSTMIMVLARNGDSGPPSGFLKLVHGSDISKDK